MNTALRYPVRLLVAALALGIATNYLIVDSTIGISLLVLVGAGLVVLLGLSHAEGRPPTKVNLWLAAAALVFSACLVWRESLTLQLLNVGAVLGLLSLLMVSFRSASLARRAPEDVAADLSSALGDAAFRPLSTTIGSLTSLRMPTTQFVLLAPIGRGMLLAVPIVMLFAGLLIAADSVFASYVTQLISLQLPFTLPSFGRILLIGFVAWCCAGGLLVALEGPGKSWAGQLAGSIYEGILSLFISRPQPVGVVPAEGDTSRLTPPLRPIFSIGVVEALTVLLAVNVLFGGFMLIQSAYLFGGLDTLARTNMTYAEYARRGFFELLTVAILALAMLCTLAIVTRRELLRERLQFNSASALLVFLVLGLLASSWLRMQLYEDAYGYTELRLYVFSFILWLAVLLLIVLVALFSGRATVVSFGGLLLTVASVIGLNVANPDAMVVRENVARYEVRGETLDLSYLMQLSSDATPALVEILPRLTANDQLLLSTELAAQRQLLTEEQQSGVLAWHFGRWQALQAIDGEQRIGR